MRISLRIVALVAAASLAPVLSAAPPDPAPGTASGYFSIDGKKFELKYAYALAQPNSFEPKRMDTAILLTDKPVAEDQLAKTEKLSRVGVGENRNAVLFELEDTGRAVREVISTQELGDGGLQMSGKANANVTISSKTADRIQGTAEMKGPEAFMNHKYEIHAKFSAVLRQVKRK